MHAAYEGILADLVEACRRHYGDRLASVAVYGSVGRGTPRFDSDVDLLIVAEGLPDGRFARVDDFRDVEKVLAPSLAAARTAGLRPELSPVFKTPAELARGTPLLLDMTEDARILHDPDGCLAGVLDRLRHRLRELGSRRVWRGDAWYWDLKPDYRWGDVIELF
ncbi:MAG: nucleotidyltransferase domain-containing protein [Acidobacteria bacterium]|nr:nucleotidyltransferase domain-containing protein [Acidobacteriota bacterium]